MKTMVERNEVLTRYQVKGQSKRQIADEMHISRHTVSGKPRLGCPPEPRSV